MTDLHAKVRALYHELGRAPTQKELRARKIWNSGNGGYPNLRSLYAAIPIPFWDGTPNGNPMDRKYGKDLPDWVGVELRKMADRLGRPPRYREVVVINLWAPARYGFATLKDLLQHLGMTPKRDFKPWTTRKRETYVAYLKRRQAAEPKRQRVIADISPRAAAVAPVKGPKMAFIPRRQESDPMLEPSWMDRQEAVA